jgi:(E)-4-hydroxy-3-methylbut-2-enyl-diphosphate synthase
MASELPFDMDTLVSGVEKRLAGYDDPIEIAVLGTATGGIGEARDADFGITGANGAGIIFAKGQPLKKVPAELLVEEVFKEVDRYYAAGKKVVIDDAHAAEAARWLSEQKVDTTL